MKILVTGASGFIGSHILDKYKELGHDVVGVDKLGGNSLKIDLSSWSVEMLSFLLQGTDVVNHHAAQVDVRKSLVDPVLDAEHNIQVTLKLLEACVRAKVKRFIFASSGGAIADGFPTSPYGIAKQTSEAYISFYARQYGLECIILRYSNVYGPRQTAGVIPVMMRACLQNKPFTINGDGRQTRDYIYVEDVVASNVCSLQCPPGTYTISTGIASSILQLIDKLPPIQTIHAPAIQGEVRDSLLVPSGPLDWNPTVSLEEGLRRTFEYCKMIY